MTAIRIVCSFDAADLADTLMRLLAAEQHDVRLSRGRQSLAELPEARSAKEVVLLIWSKEAPGAHYMREWANAIEPARLVELIRGGMRPACGRRAPVLDFTTWRGERGGKAWHALKDRLRLSAAAWEPALKQPPLRAAAALGVLSACAVTGALVLRADEPPPPQVAFEPTADATDYAFAPLPEHIAGGVGGALRFIEPPSADDLDAPMALPARMRVAAAYGPLADYLVEPLGEAPDLAERTLLQRLAALNPLRGDDDI